MSPETKPRSTDSRKRTRQKWSVMVYMAGDNNLSEEMVWGLQEMNGFFFGNSSTNVDLSVQFDAFGTYPRRYRFRSGGPPPPPWGSDGTLRRYRNEDPPLSGPQGEDMILETELRAQELDSIGRVALDRAHQNGEFHAALSDRHVQIFRGLPREVQNGPAGSLAANFPFQPPSSPQQNEVDEALRRKLRYAADYLLADVAANAQLQDFVIDMVREHEPSDLRAVILSGHGNGAFGDFLPDEDPDSSLSIPDIGTFIRLLRIALYINAGGYSDEIWQQPGWTEDQGGLPTIGDKHKLSECPEIHILGMDSCLMSTLEVCYEIRYHAKYLVGAEGFVPLSGWPYQRVLEALGDSASATVDEIVRSYYRYYSDYEDAGLSTDLSAIDLGEIENVADRLDELVRTLSVPLGELMGFRRHYSAPDSIPFAPENLPLDELDELRLNPPLPPGYAPENGRIVRNALVLARWSAQSYQWENQVDIWDFCDQLHRFLPTGGIFAPIHQSCELVKDAVEAAVLTNGWSGADFQHSHGLSVYFPFSATQFSPEYYGDDPGDVDREYVRRGVSFANEQGRLWSDFLRRFLRITRRVRRNQMLHIGSASEFNSFRRQGLLEDPLDISAFSNYRVRSGGPFNTRSGGPFNTRSGGPFNTRSGGPFNTKGACSMAKNTPDGFYPDGPEHRGRE